MSKKKGLDFAAGRLGAALKLGESSGQELPAKGDHYNSGRLGIVADLEHAAEDQRQPGAAADTPLPECQEAAAPDAPADRPDERVVCDVDDYGHDVLETPATTTHTESTDASSSATEKGVSFRLGSPANSAPDRTGRGKSSRFNVEVYASSKRRSRVPAIVAVVATICAASWFVWQRTEARLRIPQAASAAAAPLLSGSKNNDGRSTQPQTPATNSQNNTAKATTPTPASGSGAEGARKGWMGELSRSFLTWSQAKLAAAAGNIAPAATDPANSSQAPAVQAATEVVKSPRYRSCPSGISLSSVMLTDRRPMACINGKFVTIGSVINGARVVKIFSDSVEMEIEGERFEVVLGAGL